MPARDPNHGFFLPFEPCHSHWLCVSCCTPVAVPEKSHSYTNKKCIFLCYLHFCLLTNLSIYFFFFLQGTQKMLYLISGRPTDLNLLDLSQYWVLTKSKYSAALHMSCLLSWEENGKLLFPAFWKKRNYSKNIWIFIYPVWSLLVLALIFWNYSCLCSSTEHIFLC